MTQAFRSRAEEVGTGYQTMINEALKYLSKVSEPPITESVLRRILKEEFTSNFGRNNLELLTYF